jgi:peptidoglycan hydrolase-like protein with peptidoglycan-binding domain
MIILRKDINMKSKLEAAINANPTLEIQLYLNEISSIYSDIPKITPTGILDLATKDAVIQFQKHFNLPQSGKIDFETWKEIRNVYESCCHKTKTPNKLACFPSDIQEFKLNDEGDIVFMIQIMLKNFKRKYDNYPAIGVSGRYGTDTETAVKYFQKISGLPVTGIVSRETWNKMTDIYNICKIFD